MLLGHLFRPAGCVPGGADCCQATVSRAAFFTAISTSYRFCPVSLAYAVTAACTASTASDQGRHASPL